MRQPLLLPTVLRRQPQGRSTSCTGVLRVLILSMSSRTGGAARGRRARGKGVVRKAERAPKTAADLDAEMEVRIDTYLSSVHSEPFFFF